MTRDTGALRHLLRLALALAPIGCGKSSGHDPVPRSGDCPTGNWCGTAASVAKVKAPGSQADLGCESSFSSQDGLPGEAGGVFVTGSLDEAATQAKRAAGDNDTCCYRWIEPCPGGRALVDGTRTVVAAAPRADGLAALWLADALAEHASIASFARATIELLALGAPADLVRDTQRAGLDEVRHAERCFALASRYAGRALEPGPLEALAPRATDLARLARDSFVEGCVGETVSALIATRALAWCTDPAVAKVLRGIVKDETRHAALAWRTVRWAIERGGAPVIAALREVARPPDRASAPRDASLAAHGRLDPEAQRVAERDAWRDIILPTLEELTA